MSELRRLDAGHAPAVLAFELANRAYFAASVPDRGDAFFDRFTDRFDALLTEQDAGVCAFHVLVAEDGSMLGRFNLVDIEDQTAELGYRVAQHVAGRGWRRRPSGSCADWRCPRTGCVRCGRPPCTGTSRPNGCWSRRGSSPSDPSIRRTWAARREPGISATLLTRLRRKISVGSAADPGDHRGVGRGR